jgi:hypothetical protein
MGTPHDVAYDDKRGPVLSRLSHGTSDLDHPGDPRRPRLAYALRAVLLLFALSLFFAYLLFPRSASSNGG